MPTKTSAHREHPRPATQVFILLVAVGSTAVAIVLYSAAVIDITRALTSDPVGSIALAGGIVIATAGFVSVTARPDWGLYLLVLTIPLGNLNIQTSALTISPPNVLLMTVAMGVLAKTVFGSRSYFGQNPLFWPKFGLLAWIMAATIISALIAPNSEATSRFLITRLGYALTFLIPLVVVTDTNQFKVVFRLVVGSATVASALTIAAAFLPNVFPEQVVHCADVTLPILNTPRCAPFGLSVHPFASWVLIALPPAALSIFRPKILGIDRKIAVACTALLSLALMISQVRGAWVSLVVTAVVMLLFAAKPKQRGAAVPLYFVAVVIASAIAGAVLWFAVFRPIVGWRVENVSIRMEEYRLAISLFREHAFFGVGPLDDRFLALGPLGMPGVDNSFLVELAATGILGFIPFVVLWSGAFSSLRKMRTVTHSRSQDLSTLAGLNLVCLLLYLISIQAYIGIGEKGPWLIMGLAGSLAAMSSQLVAVPQTRLESAEGGGG